MAVLFLSLAIVILTSLAKAQKVGNKEKEITCTGMVIDEKGQPVAGAKVSQYDRLYGQLERSYDTRLGDKCFTKADGSFTLNIADKSNESIISQYIIVEKEGLAPGLTGWHTRVGKAKEPEIKLTQKMELVGTVVDESGKPIPQAEVCIYWLVIKGEGNKLYPVYDIAPELFTTETDQAGRFAFTNLPAQAKVDFLVRKTGYANVYTYTTSRDMKYVTGQRDIKLVLVKEARIGGVVVDKDSTKPVSGVKLGVRTEQNHSIVGQEPVSTGEDGTFSINSLDAGNYYVQVVRLWDGLDEWVAEPVTVKLETEQIQKDLRVEVCKGGILEVLFTDAQSKEPLEKARVNVRDGRNRVILGRSDENGVARVRLMPGEHRITTLENQGYMTQRQRGDTITIVDGKTVRIERQLDAPPKITGVVRDEENRPVKGATVNVHPIGSNHDATTDAEGRFEVSWSSQVAIPPWYGTARWLMARHEGRNLVAVDEDVTEDTKARDIRLKPGVIMTGKVVAPDGEGISGANLKVTLQGPKWPTILKTGSSKADGNGNFEIRAIPSGHSGSIKAYVEGYGSSQAKFHADAAKDHHLTLDPLTLAVANLSVSGLVTDLQGQPVPKATIASNYGAGQPERLVTNTDSQGRFTLNGVCEGQLNIRVNTVYNGKRLSAKAITNGGATGIKIIVREGRSAVQNLRVKTYDQVIRNSEKVIAGVALDESGSLIMGVPVGVFSRKKKRADGTYSWKYASPADMKVFTDQKATTDEQGRFAIELKEDGEYNLLLSPDQHAALIVYDVPAGKKDLKVTLPEGGTVTGRLVRMDKGKKVPIQNVEIKINALDGNAYMYLGTAHYRTTMTDAEGRFRFEHLRTKIRPPGSWSEEKWDYSARLWKISYADTSEIIGFYESKSIDDFELLVKPDSIEAQLQVGELLPEFDGIKIDLSAEQVKDKAILVCFFDMNQRPSRNCIWQLSKRAKELKAKDVVIVAIQASKIDENVLNEWIEKNNIPFPAGMVQGEVEKSRVTWGVRSLPWLILTDKEHIITAEGFGVDELDEKLGKIIDAESTIEGDMPVSAKPADQTIESGSLKSFLDAQAIFDRWEANYGHINSMKFKALVRLVHAENPRVNYSRFSHWDKIIDGKRFYVRHTGNEAGFEDEDKVIVVSFDGSIGKSYISGTKIGEICRGLKKSAPALGNPVKEYLHLDPVEITSEIASSMWDESRYKIMETFQKEFPEGVPRFAYDFIVGEKLGRQIRVLPELESVAGQLCHILEITPHIKYLFAHEKGMLLLKYVINYENGDYVKEEVLKVASVETDIGQFWYPSEATREIKNGDEILKYEFKIGELIPHVKVPPETFDIVFPEGTKIYKRPYSNPDGSVSWMGNHLSDISGLSFDRVLEQAKDKMVLVCFFDIQQRPSRNFMLQLSKKAQELEEKDVIIVTIHASEIEQAELDKWAKDNDIPFSIKTVRGDERTIQQVWGVKSLPWLILTDKRHTVTAEGFGTAELDQKLNSNSKY